MIGIGLRRGGVGLAALVALATLGACSSSASSGAKKPAPTSTPAAVKVVVATPAEVARALADRIVDEANLPVGSVPSTAPPPALLDTLQSSVGFGNLVSTHRLFTAPVDPASALQYVSRHRGSGFEPGATSYSSELGSRVVWGMDESLRVMPDNISIAQLQVAAVKAAGGGSVIRVDALVGWTAPRPAAETVPARDLAVTVSRTRGFAPPHKYGSEVVTDPIVRRRLVAAFDGLRIMPPNDVHGCPMIGAQTIEYSVAFAVSATAPPDLVATLDGCGNVGATALGKALPPLLNDAAFDAAVRGVFPN